MSEGHDMNSARCHCEPEAYAVCRACCVGKDSSEADPDCPVCDGTGAQEAGPSDAGPFVLVHYDEEGDVEAVSGRLQEYPW